MLGVVKLVPVPNELPPVAAAYQLMVPALAVAPSVTVPVPHLDPVVEPEIVGTELFVNTTSSVEGVQPLLDIVHLNVAPVPAVMPVIVVVADDVEVMVAVPETTDQAPVPEVGVLAAMVNVAFPQFD
jgi:hypothetical protein